MKKVIIVSILLIFAVTLFNCEEDEYIPPYGDFSSFVWWSSPAAEYNSVEKSVRVNNFLSFTDLSKGVLSHEWQISAGSAFLSAGFSETDSLNYANYIIPNSGLRTSENTIFVLFQQAGTSEVKLINTFKDSVAESVKEGDIWKVEKTITVTVAE